MMRLQEIIFNLYIYNLMQIFACGVGLHQRKIVNVVHAAKIERDFQVGTIIFGADALLQCSDILRREAGS